MIGKATRHTLFTVALLAASLLALLAIALLWQRSDSTRAVLLARLLAGLAVLNVAALAVAAFSGRAGASDAPDAAVGVEPKAIGNEELEGRVRRRTSELAALSSHLQQVSEKEKASLARALHDELGGLLIAVKMDVSWLHKRWPNPSAEIQARWARVLKALDDGVDFKRRVVENLRPTLLDNMGLLPAVRWIVEETCSRAGLQYTEIYPEQEPQLSEDAAIMVFRLVQESLVNVAKHAHATHVRLQIDVDAAEMRVLIEDNGSGIEPERRDSLSSHGLAIMRHRVRSSGGALQLDLAAHGGTRVLARLPLSRILRDTRSAQTPAGSSSPASAGAPGSAAPVPVRVLNS
ncbi:MAG TPA: ATP-binding protein [Steroidobacteraceae bacterium]|nr:ATP-binding protein [Steroidobacteraceae bacterium]